MRLTQDNVSSSSVLYLLAGVVSVALSYWITSHQVIINPDAICYLLSANEIGQSGVRAAMQLCGQSSWPLYSSIIYLLTQSHLFSLTGAAYFLDAVLTLISVLSFIGIVKLLGGSRRALWLAAFVILSAHQFNAVRQYIVRDHGFWAFYLLSMMFMLQYVHDRSVRNALGFAGALFVASLFRVEGAIFLLTLPLLAFVCDGSVRERVVSYLKLNCLTIVAVLTVAGWVLLHPQESLSKLGRVSELVNQVVHGFSLIAERFHISTAALKLHVLPHEAGRDAGMMWLLAMMAMYVLNIINNLSWMAAALVVYALWSGVVSQFSRASRYVLAAYVSTNLLICAVFFAERLFFSKRYLIALSLTLLLLVPFALDKLLSESASQKQRAVAWVAMIFFFFSSVGVVMDTGASRTHLRDAGQWLAANIPADARLYSNDLQLAYYSQHYGNQIFTAMKAGNDVDALLNGQLNQYEYAALLLNQKRDERIAMMLEKMHAPLIQDFVNQHGDHVKVYKIPQQAVQTLGV